MKKDPIEKLFARLENAFDIEAPHAGHQNRFLEKLDHKKGFGRKKPGKIHYLKTWGAVAASIAILVVLVFAVQENKAPVLANVSTEMSKTQHFYSTVITRELREIEKQQTPETKKLVQDAMAQLQKLEREYAGLQKDLAASGEDNRVIYAMIANFQNRIKVLRNVLEKIAHIKQLKQQSHENPITI